MGIRQRRAGLQPAGTAQLKKSHLSRSVARTPPTAINLPVNLYDYIFDVPQEEDAIKPTEKVNTRGVRRGARDSGAPHVRACVSWENYGISSRGNSDGTAGADPNGANHRPGRVGLIMLLQAPLRVRV